MALSLGSIQRSIITSIFGSRLGLDQSGYLAGPPDVRRVVTDLTSASTATTIPNNGVVQFTGTSLGTSAAGGTFVLGLPVPGVSVTIANLNANTSAASPGCTAFTMIRPSTAFVILATDASTLTTINLVPGSAITLTGLTTGLYQVTGRGTTLGVILNGTT
jgi:hypothetical protein